MCIYIYTPNDHLKVVCTENSLQTLSPLQSLLHTQVWCVSAYLCLCPCVSVHVSVSLSLWVSLCPPMLGHAFALTCLCAWVCVCLRLCVSVSGRVCVCCKSQRGTDPMLARLKTNEFPQKPEGEVSRARRKSRTRWQWESKALGIQGHPCRDFGISPGLGMRWEWPAPSQWSKDLKGQDDPPPDWPLASRVLSAENRIIIN